MATKKKIVKALAKKAPKSKKPVKLLKPEVDVKDQIDLQYYSERLAECQDKLKAARNDVLALEALQLTYLNRLAELQDHH